MASTDPKTATQGQWEDLASKVKAKSDVDITMTNVDPGEGAALAADHYIGVYGGDPIITDYSTNEINTGAKWINGYNIYKKTVPIVSFPNNAETSLGDLLPADIHIVKIEGTATAGTGVLQINGYRPQSTVNTVGVRADQSTGEVLVASGADMTSYSGYVTFYYTKSS